MADTDDTQRGRQTMPGVWHKLPTDKRKSIIKGLQCMTISLSARVRGIPVVQ